jgi:hypothetical protein
MEVQRMTKKHMDGLSARAREMAALVAEWRASGLPLATFATACGVKPGTLSWWTWRLRQLEGGDRDEAPALIPVRVVPDPPASTGASHSSRSFVLALGDGRELQIPAGFALEDLKRLLAVVSP